MSHEEKLGLTINIDDKQNLPFVTNILKDSAIDKTGCIKVIKFVFVFLRILKNNFKKGDFVLKINNIDTKFKNLDELVELLTLSKDNVISLFVESNLNKNKIDEFPYFCRALVKILN